MLNSVHETVTEWKVVQGFSRQAQCVRRELYKHEFNEGFYGYVFLAAYKIIPSTCSCWHADIRPYLKHTLFGRRLCFIIIDAIKQAKHQYRHKLIRKLIS